MIDISLYIPLLTKAFLSCVLGQPAKLREEKKLKYLATNALSGNIKIHF